MRHQLRVDFCDHLVHLRIWKRAKRVADDLNFLLAELEGFHLSNDRVVGDQSKAVEGNQQLIERAATGICA